MSEKRRKRKLLPAVILMAAAVLGVLKGKDLAVAVFNSETAVHVKADEVENATLIIGTHLIYLHSLNDTIYEIAVESASNSGQSAVYYKSELAEGAWFDITEASSIGAITEEGTPVDNSIIEALDMTHHTKSDGITYDLRTSQSVCIFDIYSVYELESMEELEPLKLQYDLRKESGNKTEEDEYHIGLIQGFFARETKTELTEDYDTRLEALQRYYEQLSGAGASSEETQAVQKVMDKLDSSRKAVVYEQVISWLDVLQDDLAGTGSSEEESSYQINTELLTAAGDSMSNLSEALIEYQGNTLSEGTTRMSSLEYSLSTEMIRYALSDDYASCDTQTAQLIHLFHVMDGLIVSAKDEIAILDILIGNGSQVYSSLLTQGISEEYTQAQENRSSNALLKSLAGQRGNEVNILRNELQYYIEEKAKRLSQEEAQAYITARIRDSDTFTAVILTDDFQEEMKDSVEAYVQFLQSLLTRLAQESGAAAAANEAYEQKEELTRQRLEALDKNDLDRAKQLEALIAQLEEQIKAQEEALTKQLTELEQQKSNLEGSQASQGGSQASQGGGSQESQDGTQESQEGSQTSQGDGNGGSSSGTPEQLAEITAKIAELTAQLNEGSEAKNIMNMKEEALKYIQQSDVSDSGLESIAAQVEGLKGFVDTGSSLALTAEKAIYQELTAQYYLNDCSQYEELIGQIEDIVAESALAIPSNALSAEDALETLSESIQQDEQGTPVESDDTLAALIALGTYGEEAGNTQIQELAAGMSKTLEGSGASAVFQARTGVYGAFAPADALAKYLGYRYVWNDTKKTALLARGRVYYSFTAFQWEVAREGGKTDEMNIAAEFDGTVYIPADYLLTELEAVVYAIPGTEFSVLVSDEIIEQSSELLSELKEKGGSMWE